MSELSTDKLDVESECSGYGAHKRCVVLGEPDSSAVTVRADDKGSASHLPWPTIEQARKVAMGTTRVHEKGRLRYSSQHSWYSPEARCAVNEIVFEVKS